MLSGYLDVTETELMPLLTKPDTHFVYLKKKVPALTYSAIAADLAERELYGVFRETDPIRTYPNGAVGAAVVGFVGADGKGQAGLESVAQRRARRRRGQGDLRERAERQQDPAGPELDHPGPNGLDLPDHDRLRAAVGGRAAARRSRCASPTPTPGFAITMNVKTGEILAMANAPTFDSANHSRSAQTPTAATGPSPTRTSRAAWRRCSPRRR